MLRRLGVTDRWSKAFDAAVIFFGLVGLVQLALWFNWNAPVEVHYRVIETLSVPPGGELRYTNIFTRHKFCETRVDRWFVGSDGAIRYIDPLPAAMPTTGLEMRQSSDARITVPKDMPPGMAKSCFRSRWQCNPLHRIWPITGPDTCIAFVVEPPASMSWWPELFAPHFAMERIEGGL